MLCLNQMSEGEIKVDDRKVSLLLHESAHGGAHPSFHAVLRGLFSASGETYAAVEAPKRDVGVHLVPNGRSRPYRCAICAPGFAILSALNMMGQVHMVSDAVTIIGTQDIILYVEGVPSLFSLRK